MIKAELPKKPGLLARVRGAINRMSVRSRICTYFLLFTALLLALLWLFQIVLLPDFYRIQNMRSLTSSTDTVTRNIDNDDLSALVDRISESNNVCVLIVDANMRVLNSAEASPGCIIHHLSKRDLRVYLSRMDDNENQILSVFPLRGFRNSAYDDKQFAGKVPPSDNGKAQSMIAMQKAVMADGTEAYVFLNAIITPVSATVQTLRSQFALIALLLTLLSFLLSLVLSHRVTKPIIAASEAAKMLASGQYEPAKTRVSYREITELNQTLTQAAADLRKGEALQRELIANISHDLRTPLTLIEGYAEVMRDLPGENTPENMQVIIDETKRLSTLVNAVLEYSVAKSGGGKPDCKVFDLTESILTILTRYQKLTEQDGYSVVFDYQRHVYVRADELKVGQVVYNLINNALTYTGEDKAVTVRQTAQNNGMALIEVIDTGEGIEPEELPYIWSRYYRGQKPHKRAAIGTGLGLSIVQGILDAHGLEYGVTSQIGEGTTFWFRLPIEGPESA